MHRYFLAILGIYLALTFPLHAAETTPAQEADRLPAVQNGYIYTREFAHAKVRLDIENEVGEIKWLEPEKN